MKPALRRVRDNFWASKTQVSHRSVYATTTYKEITNPQTISVTNLTGLPIDTHLSSNHLCQECSVFLAATPSQPLRKCCMQAVLGFYLSFTHLRSLVSEAYLLKLNALVIGGEVITEQSKLTQSYLAHGRQARALYHRYRPRRYARALRSSCLMMAGIAHVLTTINVRASYQGRGSSEV